MSNDKGERKIYLVNSIENAQYLDFILLDYERQEPAQRTYTAPTVQEKARSAINLLFRSPKDYSRDFLDLAIRGTIQA